MAKRFLMKTAVADVVVELNESSTADAVWLALPFETYVNVWGEEIYFEIPVEMRLENGQRIMQVGDVAYWPEGKALCFFFGRTPVSTGPEPIAISPVTPIGKVIENLEGLKAIGDRMRASLDRI